jgi:hypothetical protein
MAEPMAMDSGIAGLEQSQHHPLAGRSQFNPVSPTPLIEASEPPASPQGDAGDPTESVIQSLKACVIPGKMDEASRLIRVLRDMFASTTTTSSVATSLRTSRTSFSEDDPVTIGQLKSILQEALQKPTLAIPQRPSYASVARQPTNAPTGNFQVIPERRMRELRIRATNQTEDLARRSAVEVVAATNTALGTTDVVATRRLPSGDTILTFQEAIPKTALQDQAWVQRVFGATAQLHESEFAVIAKGLPSGRITKVDPETLLKDVQHRIPEVVRLKVEPPRTPSATFTTAILHLRSAAAATRLCERGLVWEAQIFNCEPYTPDLRVSRCYQCHQFGHISRYCKNKPRCGHCAGPAHPQGETDCPRLHGPKTCVNCRGSHAAWDRQCPKAIAAKEQAHIAYQHRPRQFEVLKATVGRVASTTLVSSQDSDDGFQVVRSKRLRTLPPTQGSQTRASETPARRGRPPLAAIDRVNVQSRDISEMFSQGSADPFLTQDVEIPSTQL